MVYCLTGCGANNADAENSVFTLTYEEKDEYKLKIDEILGDFYWKFDENTISYYKDTVPQKGVETNAKIFEACNDAEFDLKAYSGKECVVATVDLLHFNGDKAGLAYFYFNKKIPIGVYYTSGIGGPNSLKSRNVYLSESEFKVYESDAPMSEFTERNSRFPVDGFSSVGHDSNGNVMLAVKSGNKLLIYKYRNGFNLYKSLYFDKLVISAAFNSYGNENGDGIAVILGNAVGYEEGSYYTVSENVMFYDNKFNSIGNDFTLESGTYTCISTDESSIILSNGKTLEYYDYSNGVLTKGSQFYFDHGIRDFKKVDLDSDGKYEYLISDGMDFYLYRKNGTSFKLIWKTHLGIESLKDNIYTGDLNQDGIYEIYVCDKTDTTIRYVISEKGIISRNDDIEYGQRFYVADYNNDGKDDYVKINDIENTSQKLYIAN